MKRFFSLFAINSLPLKISKEGKKRNKNLFSWFIPLNPIYQFNDFSSKTLRSSAKRNVSDAKSLFSHVISLLAESFALYYKPGLLLLSLTPFSDFSLLPSEQLYFFSPSSNFFSFILFKWKALTINFGFFIRLFVEFLVLFFMFQIK